MIIGFKLISIRCLSGVLFDLVILVVGLFLRAFSVLKTELLDLVGLLGYFWITSLAGVPS